METLASLSPLPSLSSLDLSCTGISYKGVARLAAGPAHHRHAPGALPAWAGLRRLVLSFNSLHCVAAEVKRSLGAEVGRALGSLLERCRALEEVYLEACGMEGEALGPHTRLTEAIAGMC